MAAQGSAKLISYKKQVALGTAASGSGGQYVRRRPGAMFTLARDSYDNDEMASHRQSTGVTLGVRRGSGKVPGALSPNTYQDWFSSLMKKAWVATANVTGLSLTIASIGNGSYTITRSAGDWLAAVKVFDVGRLTAGTFNAANLNKNLFVIAATTTVLTVRPLNGVALVAEGPIASATWATPGKKVWGAITAHTDDWYTVEEWYADIAKSELWPDSRPTQAAIGLPATGNSTVDWDWLSLNRVRGTSQVLTTPAAESTTGVVQSISAVVVINGVATPVTGMQFTINSGDSPGEAETGSNGISDIAKGSLSVSGQFTAKFNNTTMQDAFDDATAISIGVAVATDGTATADFVAFGMSKLKLTGDSPDDGRKEIIRTYPFTAEINGSGGAGLAHLQTIISHQDSLAT